MITATVREQNDVVWEREVEALFREHYGFMYRAANAVIGRRTDAEDVIQNLFLKFVQHELRSEIRTNPKGYLHRAAVNESLNLIRSRDRRKETDGVEELEVPEPGTGRVNDNVRNKLRDTFTELKPNVVQIVAEVRAGAKQLMDALEDFA
jgi:RNA polymerase sigma factor (sigma-70 family)